MSTPNCEGEASCVQTSLFSLSQCAPVPPSYILSCTSFSVPYKAYPNLRCLILCPHPNPLILTYVPSSLSSLSQCSLPHYCQIFYLVQSTCWLSWFLKDLICASTTFIVPQINNCLHPCGGTFIPFSFNFSQLLLVLLGHSMKVTGEPVQLYLQRKL